MCNKWTTASTIFCISKVFDMCATRERVSDVSNSIDGLARSIATIFSQPFITITSMHTASMDFPSPSPPRFSLVSLFCEMVNSSFHCIRNDSHVVRIFVCDNDKETRTHTHHYNRIDRSVLDMYSHRSAQNVIYLCQRRFCRCCNFSLFTLSLTSVFFCSLLISLFFYERRRRQL